VNFPAPTDEAFISLVQREIAEANKRAIECLDGKDPWKPIRAKLKQKASTRKPIVKATKKMNGTCKGCGCHYDKYTKGCNVCMQRHHERRWVKKVRERASRNRDISVNGNVGTARPGRKSKLHDQATKSANRKAKAA
jgi:hypothetical protein